MSDVDPAARYNRTARWTSLIQRAQLDAILAEADREQTLLRRENHRLRAQLAIERRRNHTPRHARPGDAT